MRSVRKVARRCLGLSGSFSVAGDLFGYPRVENGARLTIFNNSRQFGLAEQLDLVEGPALDINMIVVAHERLSDFDYGVIQKEVADARKIFAQVGLGIRRVDWFKIDEVDAEYAVEIRITEEAHRLWREWNGPEGALDAFVVPAITTGPFISGLSPTNGPCRKGGRKSGLVIEKGLNAGGTLAHEIGHFLGLEHTEDEHNFMFGETGEGSETGITQAQGDIMKRHCFVSTCGGGT